MAVEQEDDEDAFGAEVVAGMLAEELTVTDGACSLVTAGCEVMPSEESAQGKRHVLPNKKIRRCTSSQGKIGGRQEKPDAEGELSWTPHTVAI